MNLFRDLQVVGVVVPMAVCSHRISWLLSMTHCSSCGQVINEFLRLLELGLQTLLTPQSVDCDFWLLMAGHNYN